jgi:hypothetical protein
MTQDEREQKALEAARVTIDHDKIRDRKAMALAFRWAGKEGIDHHYVWAEKFAHAYHAAMTEGGVWVSRKDAAFIADSLETTAPLIAKVGTPEGFTAKERSLSIAARIRAKLEGNHDT